MNTPNYCPLPITDRRRAYVSSHNTTPEYLAEVFRRHQPILVSAIGQYGDDYDDVQKDDWLSAPGGFK
jgi:hypothetical protein